MKKSSIVTARIPAELMEKIRYLEINVTDVIRDSLLNEVIDREKIIKEMGEWKIIGGLLSSPESVWRQFEGLSGEELRLAQIRYVAKMKKDARETAEELARRDEFNHAN